MPSLLKPTNNLMSNIMVHSSALAKIEVGMGATLAHYTDREAGTVIETFEVKHSGKSWKYVKVQEDNAVRTDSNGMSDCQDYDYTPNPNGYIHTFRFNEKKERWEGARYNEQTKRWKAIYAPGLILGRRDKYHDFSF